MSGLNEIPIAEDIVSALAQIEKAEKDLRIEFADLYSIGNFNGERAKAWRHLRQCGDNARKLLKSINQPTQGLRS